MKGRIAVLAAVAYALLSILGMAKFARDTGTARKAPEENLVKAGETQITEAVEPEKASFLELQRLPALERMSEVKTREYISDMMVVKKIEKLGLTDEDWLFPERELETLGTELSGDGPHEATVNFDGRRASELNAFLRENAGAVVSVTSRSIDVDETIFVPDDTALLGGGARLNALSEIDAFTLDHVSNVAIRGFSLSDGFACGVLVMGCDVVLVDDCDIGGASCKPIAFMGTCHHAVVRGNRLRGNQKGGLYFNGDISNVLVEENDIEDNGGTSNWMAGIVLTGIDVKDEARVFAAFDENLHFPEEQPLDTMLAAPHNVILRGNRVMNNNATGVYCDGGYRVYVVKNRIEGNDKEGMCLDYGTVAAYVSGNDIVGNGNRARQSDADLENDFVLGLGRLEDGSACAKLPGLSIDNAAYNIVYNNNISENYGSGIKLVRSGLRNVLSTNLITDNNRGASDSFHFFGIELGFALADKPVINLDYRPEYENIVCRNMITGTHYAGIYISEGAYINDFFDNVIMDATHWAMECLSEERNSSVNNYSALESRGI